MAQRGTSAPMFRTNGAKIKVAAFVIVALLFIAYLSRSSDEPYRPPKNSEENSNKDTPPKDTPPMDPPKGPPPKETKPPVKLPDRPEDLVEPTFSYPTDQDPNNAYGHTFAPTPSYQNREDMKCFSNCGGNGWCFLGKCYCYPGYKGRYCNVPWTQKPPLCDLKSDSCFVASHGVAMVSRDRWLYAQKAEQALWSNNQATDDRAQEHVDGFKGYASVPDNLGHVLEVGCGPWTQSKFMLQQRNTFKVETMTLWEPGLLFYVQNTPTCTYKDGNFLGLSTVLVNAGAELLLLHEEYDTVILINVLEHVQNAFQIMENVFNSLKPGGILIFNDRWWDSYDFYGYKVGGEFGLWGQDRLYHPIHLKKQIFEHMMSFFDVLLDNRDAVALTSRQLEGTYFIGRKKRRN